MRDKSLSIFLMVLFAISSIAILVVAWLRPMPDIDKIITTIIGSAGILFVLVRSLPIKKVKTEQVALDADTKNNR
jgi:hypothetical protein